MILFCVGPTDQSFLHLRKQKLKGCFVNQVLSLCIYALTVRHRMYEKILVPTDGSKDAQRGAEHGVQLAAAIGATVHALYVIEEGTNPWNPASLDDQLDQARAYGDDVTGEVADLADEAGVECVTDTVVGAKVWKRILKYAEEEGVDTIVIGSGYRGRMGDMLGSTADKVIRNASIPVTVLKGEETG